MFVITGATGALNGATVDHLMRLVPAKDIAVVVRDVPKAQRFADLGVEVRYGDYAEAASLATAFSGAGQILLVSASDPGADAVGLHRTAINAAVEAGADRILYTSHQGADLESPFRPARDHAATEQLLAGSGVPWTALRNGFYAHSINWLMGPWRETGVMTVPADGPVSWTAREDAAEAAAVILASGGKYNGPTTLTAGAAPTFEDIAAIAADLTGTDVARVVIDEERWVERQIAGGTPDFMAHFTLGIYRAAAAGGFGGVDPLLGELLGREPQTVRDLLIQQPR